jgi:hypothetical protein
LSGATPNATQLIEELRWALEENRREVERLTTERDEARRGLCYEVAAWVAGFKHSTHEAESRAEAERRGWDCFQENTDAQ